ncbi:putative AlkP superfamily pyrophosphatase or phosphodiesterase [Allocatelliglobosispora scoriae]|uniref:Putative AlkP superfamily pyrophosphatase or phosphodiesterase n=1 Tax=Allocatelliglobosispora scoriae TaxID=643052 RepID=A0A841BXE9_9ACTN|nr:alkaline phosphatase family protein [Allocatelliglobosispora scoriae]MBB5871390.1 putative AlkP superfamily pyrophosphatase or phosphodiesterase [Allocatelliglobosispora scoriae]
MQHVVVFGVDGVRWDTLHEVATPTFDAIAAAGFLSRFEVSAEAPTLSGPTWSTIATGVWPSAHGVRDNHFVGHRLADHPDFLTLVSRAGHRTYAAAAWPPLVTIVDNGPVFRAPTRLSYADGDAYGWGAADQLLADDAAAALGAGDFAAAFVYLGNPDETAHDEGTGEPYRAAIEAADRQVGEVLAAIRARPTYAAEQWTVIVVTDHGHRDGGGHGERSEWERTAWIAASGPGVPSGQISACHADVAPSVLAALGVHHDHLPGTPFAALG